MKNPSESVVKNSPVLIVFMLFGDLVMKKSSCPVYMKASPEPTRKNCGMSKKTLIGKGLVEVGSPTDLLTDNRFISTKAAAAIPKVERIKPRAIL